MSQSDLVELVADLQLQLSKRGAGAFRTLELSFAVNDRDGTGVFDFAEIEAILAKAGLFLKRQNLTKLYRYFDHDANERLRSGELLAAIRGELSPRRLNIVQQVFDALDSRGHGAVDQRLIVESYDPSRHPQALSGEKKVDALRREFALAFEGAGEGNNGAVSRAEFVSFYSGVAASTSGPYDDDFFVDLVQRCWPGVREHIPSSLRSGVLSSSRGASASPSDASYPLLASLRHTVREKVRQKTGNSASEVENLRKVFKHFDLSGTGLIDYAVFKASLERFGIYLDPATMRGVFDEFDEGAGKVNYLRFATTLYDDDRTSAASHQFARSQAVKASAAAQGDRDTARRSYVDSDRVIVSSPLGGASSASAAGGQDPKGSTVRRTLSQKEREHSVAPTVIFLVGGPAVGKATQSSRVAREFGFVQLSLPSLLRAEQSNVNSKLGAQIAAAQSTTGVVPADLSVQLLARLIAEAVGKGSLYFMVDGFPSDLKARDAWERAMSTKAEVPFVLYLEAAQAVMESRLAARAKQSGVPVDAAQVKRQFNTFARDTIAVINSYGSEGRLQVVDASGTPDAVYREVQRVIAEL